MPVLEAPHSEADPAHSRIFLLLCISSISSIIILPLLKALSLVSRGPDGLAEESGLRGGMADEWCRQTEAQLRLFSCLGCVGFISIGEEPPLLVQLSTHPHLSSTPFSPSGPSRLPANEMRDIQMPDIRPLPSSHIAS